MIHWNGVLTSELDSCLLGSAEFEGSQAPQNGTVLGESTSPSLCFLIERFVIVTKDCFLLKGFAAGPHEVAHGIAMRGEDVSSHPSPACRVVRAPCSAGCRVSPVSPVVGRKKRTEGAPALGGRVRAGGQAVGVWAVSKAPEPQGPALDSLSHKLYFHGGSWCVPPSGRNRGWATGAGMCRVGRPRAGPASRVQERGKTVVVMAGIDRQVGNLYVYL